LSSGRSIPCEALTSSVDLGGDRIGLVIIFLRDPVWRGPLMLAMQRAIVAEFNATD